MKTESSQPSPVETPVRSAGRFIIKKSGESTWNVYDNQRGVTILKTVSPNATYNESTVKEVVALLNASQFKLNKEEYTNKASRKGN